MTLRLHHAALLAGDFENVKKCWLLVERAEGALNDVVKKRKSRVVWYPVERDVNVYPMMDASAEELASQGL
jgi:hypothetical protein